MRSIRLLARVIWMCFALVWVAGCSIPTFAPPVQYGVSHLPDPMSPGEGWAQLSYSIPVTDIRGEFGLTDSLALQGGTSMIGGVDLDNIMGSVGVSYQLLDGMFPISVNGGVGGGVGGHQDTNPVTTLGDGPGKPVSGSAYPIGGGYTGFKVGMRVSEHFGTFSDTLVMLSGSPDLPATLWVTERLGLQFDMGPVHLSMEMGATFFNNEDGGYIFPNLGLAIGGGWGKVADEDS